jgi:predicted RNA-binding Zn-ribbon protein involved in translation (DUF1610 family)
MYAEIASAFATLKTMGEITSLILKTKIDSTVTEKVIDLQSSIISLQSTLMSIQAENQDLLRQKNALEQRLVEIESWNVEAQRYSLKEIACGVFVYALNPDEAKSSLAHWLCVHCYQNKQKSILQCKGTRIDGTSYLCPRCKTVIHDPTKRITISIG